MPILSNASIGNAVNVGSDEIDRLALALDLSEASCKVTPETQVRNDTEFSEAAREDLQSFTLP